MSSVCAVSVPVCVGLRAGDEILQLNDKEASALELSDLNAAFAQPSLTLTISTVPSSEPCQQCPLLPRRSDAPQNLYTDIFSQSQGTTIQLSAVGFNVIIDNITDYLIMNDTGLKNRSCWIRGCGLPSKKLNSY